MIHRAKQMEGYIGYIRVSTVKQGTQGVSLQEQRDSISRYAERNGLVITIWLEEMETAAKKGRPEFTKALRLLRSSKARGIVLHKLDRGARNLRDWNDIGELSDQGVEIHFVNEAINLQSRGGRLSADIQAVVAADYIRNLREETRKGFYGRLKQGFYPMRAPIGYLDHGKAKVKTIDPVRGPLVRKAFELYGSGKYNLETLGKAVEKLGLRNRNGKPVTRNGLSIMLNNSFYIGLMPIRKTGETFDGLHEPIVGKSLFDRVQRVLSGKFNGKAQRHVFPLRKALRCARCNYSLIGEHQKGNTYYRCHSKQCAGTSIRADIADAVATRFFRDLKFGDQEKDYFRPKVLEMREKWASQVDDEIQGQALIQSQIKDRLDRLTDAFLDQSIDKATFEERKTKLLLEKKATEERLAELRSNAAQRMDRLENFLELSQRAWLSYRLCFPEEKREILEIITSNRLVTGKDVDFKPSLAFAPLVNRFKNTDGDPQRDIPRTWDVILARLDELNKQGLLPDLSIIPGFSDSHENASMNENSDDDCIGLAA